MTAVNNKTISIMEQGDPAKQNPKLNSEKAPYKFERIKKPLIFGLMGIVCLGCLYLIFKPSETKKNKTDIGLNNAVPQATDAGMQADKQKAYEHAILEKKQEEKKNALMSLSDYWNSGSSGNADSLNDAEAVSFGKVNEANAVKNNRNPVLNSYKDAQNTLTSFYKEDNQETRQLQKQIDELKQELSEKESAPVNNGIDNQIALMEKSYQMAAKYLPHNMATMELPKPAIAVGTSAPVVKEHFAAFTTPPNNIVSTLCREPTDSVFVNAVNQNSNINLYNAEATEQTALQKNTIRACIQETQTITDETAIKLRLLEPAKMPGHRIPEGAVLTAHSKFQNGRVQLKISFIEMEGYISAVDITVHDLDGQPGLYVPYSPEMNTLSEMASNMSQTSGTSIMMTRSAGQQIAGDLSRGVIQGITGYLTKKIRTPKVTLKAGHQVLLVSKK